MVEIHSVAELEAPTVHFVLGPSGYFYEGNPGKNFLDMGHSEFCHPVQSSC